MNRYRADLHIHTLLSPCGDLEMSPVNIVRKAKEKKLDIIGITDHNTTKQSSLVKKMAEREGIFVMTGAEVTTKEEVHCLSFFDKTDALDEFQHYLEDNLPFVKNDPLIFGDQVVVDEEENISEEVDSLLIVGINQSIEQVRSKVAALEGIFIPAHVDRERFGILSQLGFMPDDLNPDAIEISGRRSKQVFLEMHPEFSKYPLVKSSDAHHPDRIGEFCSLFILQQLTFEEIRLALKGEQGREINIE